MSKYIIKMLDGGIKNIKTDNWTEASGCETCGYGGWHIGEMELHMDDCILYIKLESMYTWSLPTCEDLIHWFDDNIEKIRMMKQDEFIYFIKEFNCFSCDEVKFVLGKEL